MPPTEQSKPPSDLTDRERHERISPVSFVQFPVTVLIPVGYKTGTRKKGKLQQKPGVRSKLHPVETAFYISCLDGARPQ